MNHVIHFRSKLWYISSITSAITSVTFGLELIIQYALFISIMDLWEKIVVID